MVGMVIGNGVFGQFADWYETFYDAFLISISYTELSEEVFWVWKVWKEMGLSNNSGMLSWGDNYFSSFSKHICVYSRKIHLRSWFFR
jgi:hypothetical protein